MGKRSLKKYLYDIQQSIDSIYEYLGEKEISLNMNAINSFAVLWNVN